MRKKVVWSKPLQHSVVLKANATSAGKLDTRLLSVGQMEVEAVNDTLVTVKDKVEAKKTLNTTIYAERTIVFTAKGKDIS